jgi:hypothetical protein
MSSGFAVGHLSDAVYSVVFISVSTPNWSTLCQSVCPQGEQQNFLLSGGRYYPLGSVDDVTIIGLEPCNIDADVHRNKRVRDCYSFGAICA